MKKRLLKKFFLFTAVLGIWTNTEVNSQTKSFESNTTQGTWQSGGGSGLTFSVSGTEARTGNYALSSVSSTTSNRYVGSPAENDYTSKRTIHMIFYAKANFSASDMYFAIYAGSERNKVTGLSVNTNYQRYSNYYYDTSTRTGAYFRFGSSNSYKSPTNTTIFVDDFVVYTVDGNVPETDLSAPNTPATVSGNYSGGKALLTWTSGGDNTAAGTTGVQATMTLKYTGTGTATAPILNQQADYSNGDVIATDWVVVKNNSADAAIDDDMGAISTTTTFAVYHRDLAYNWSTGSLVTVNTTLPITLTSFKAATQTDGIALNWATSSENNADKFVVERRTATSAFVSINEVKAKGKAGNYTVSDKNVANGEIYYYRLKMVDKDASSKYSTISSASFTLNAATAVSVFPNPATNSVTVSFPETGVANTNLTVSDSKGAVVLTVVVPANTTQKTIDVSSLKTGIYIININTKEGRKTLKLVKN